MWPFTTKSEATKAPTEDIFDRIFRQAEIDREAIRPVEAAIHEAVRITNDYVYHQQMSGEVQSLQILIAAVREKGSKLIEDGRSYGEVATDANYLAMNELVRIMKSRLSEMAAAIAKTVVATTEAR